MASAKKIIRKARKGSPIRQVAAIPCRRTSGGELEVMLITSRSSKRIIIPKGWPMKGKSARKAAATEARQEAGVSGRALKRPAGKFVYWKRLSESFVPIEVTVFLLEVEHVETSWREEHCRRRAWMTPASAATLIDEPDLASLVRSIEIPHD